MNELRKRKLLVASPCYGGMNASMYTKSMADLSAICVRHGIEMAYYILQNESLITRARAYCCDEFMRSDCTHMIFIDSDIGFDPKDVITLLALQSDDSPYDVIGGAYPKKSLPGFAKIQTEDGIKSIKWIVDNKYSGKVLTLNEKTNHTEWNKVIDYSDTPNYSNKKWLSLQTSFNKPRYEVVATYDHEVAYIDDVINVGHIKYCEAKDMLGKYLIKKPRKAIKNNINALLNPEQLSVLIGAILGDGCASQGGYGCGHSIAQEKYCEFKAAIIGGNVSRKINYVSHQFSNEQTKRLCDLIYVDGKKTVKNVIDMIDEKSLAIMYMDDGNRYHYPEKLSEDTNDKSWWYDSNTLTTVRSEIKPDVNFVRGRKPDAWRATCGIATHSFTLADNLLLIDHIKKKFDIDAYIGKQMGKTELQFFLKFDKDNTDKLHNLICKYIPESMEYKLNDQYRGGEKHKFNNIPLDFAAKKVLNVVEYLDADSSHQYDIGVENNHNFFANGTLVHNCVSWEKVLVAAKKGFGDEQPNNLERFVGDYVFNPKQGVSSFRVDEPVEVQELGTGFMMIRKKTLEKYRDLTPTLAYRPDHVRTSHFDGSRLIHMYFDCAIDRGYDFQEMHDLMEELSQFHDSQEDAEENIVMKLSEKARALLEREKNATRRYLSEDYKFCYDVAKMGMKVWLCPWIKLQHVGTYIFGGSLADLANLGVAATADGAELQKYKDKLNPPPAAINPLFDKVKNTIEAKPKKNKSKSNVLPGLPQPTGVSK